MSKIMNGITTDRLETLFLHGHQAHPHEVAVMAGELLSHRKCKDCDEAKAPVVKYYAMTEPNCYTWYRKSTSKYPLLECFREDGACWVYGTCQPGEDAVSHEITKGAYEEARAATKPAAPVVEPEKSCKSCGDTACRLPDHGWNLCRSWIPKPAAPVAEPWVKTCSIDSGAIRQLQRRHDDLMKRVEAVGPNSHDVLLLHYRKAVVDKEAAVASANSQLDRGGWTSDWNHEFMILDDEIKRRLEAVERNV